MPEENTLSIREMEYILSNRGLEKWQKHETTRSTWKINRDLKYLENTKTNNYHRKFNTPYQSWNVDTVMLYHFHALVLTGVN